MPCCPDLEERLAEAKKHRDQWRRIAFLRLEEVERLRSTLQLARVFVEGKAMTPDPTTLFVIDAVLEATEPTDS